MRPCKISRTPALFRLFRVLCSHVDTIDQHIESFFSIIELELSGEEAAALLEYVHGSPAPASQTAEARLQARRIGINLKSNQIKCLFDEYGGGVPTGLLTEFCGEAGSGRTQIRYTFANRQL